jgi:LysM repeat protein
MIRRLFLLSLYFAAVTLCLPAATVAQQADPSVIIHVVQRGETLFRIALNYGVSVQEIASLNAIVDPSNIQVGQRILVPGAMISSPAVAQTHVVQPGETLRSIAELYGLSMDDLVFLNNVADPIQFM